MTSESRFQDALLIQSACNPAGVAHALARHIAEFMKTPAYGGTASICEDPALRLMAYQLAHLFGVAQGFPDYPQAHDVCAGVAAAFNEPTHTGGKQ